MLSALFDRLRPQPRITTAAGLGEFLARQASLVSQKTVIGYCHARTMLPMNELMRDQVFAAAYGRARNDAYTAILADLMIVVESRLRQATTSPAGLIAPLVGLYRSGLRQIAELPQDEIDQAALELAPRLARAQLAKPLSIAEISHDSAGKVYAALPIHERLRRADEPAIRASVRFMMVGLAEQFDRRLDVEAIAADLRRTIPAGSPLPVS